jgi:hypothetical protein
MQSSNCSDLRARRKSPQPTSVSHASDLCIAGIILGAIHGAGLNLFSFGVVGGVIGMVAGGFVGFLVALLSLPFALWCLEGRRFFYAVSLMSIGVIGALPIEVILIRVFSIVFLSWWYLATVSLAVPIAWTSLVAARVLLPDIRRKLWDCTVCGYDLRGSWNSVRCPECGAEITSH